MAFSLSHDFLRQEHPRITGPYLHKVAPEKHITTYAISQEILQSIAAETLPPRVYALWLSACPDENAIVLGLRQTDSVIVRSDAIKGFYRWFRTATYQQIWHAVDGTEGLVALLATFSVNHVKMFCKYVAKCSTSISYREERQELVTELCQALTSRFLPGSTGTQSPDRRPLLEIYATLVYECTPKTQDFWLEAKDFPKLDLNRILQSNTDWFRQKCLDKAAAGDDDLWTYSALLTSIPTMESSMAFAADVVETLIRHNIRFMKTKTQLNDIFKLLLQQIARRRTSTLLTRRLVGLMSKYAMQCRISKAPQFSFLTALETAQGRSGSFFSLELTYSQHLHDIARLWVRGPEIFEPLLPNLIDVSETKDMSDIVGVLDIVRPHQRYRLFKWLMISKLEIDIENDAQLLSIKAPIPLKLFELLPKAVGRDMFERFMSIGHAGVRPGAQDFSAELDLLRVTLHEHDDLRRTEAASKISGYRRAAEKSRNADERKGSVEDSVMMAVAAGSLDLLSETLLWSRRFIRDPVVTEFYWSSERAQNTTLRRDDTIRLLSALPQRPNEKTSLSDLATAIHKGNEIVLLLLETATMAQREPSFYANHWSCVQYMFVDIVRCRMKLAGRLQSSLSLSDDQVFKLVWEGTLDALLKAEKLGLDERNQALHFNEIGGPLAVWGDYEICIWDPPAATLRFINELAIQRDALWRGYRPSAHASVTTLQAPWPQGLPVQALLAIQVEGEVMEDALPYLKERARSVVFMPREDALREIPEDEETRAAIGCFVDDYSEALKIHLSWCGKDEKESRSKAAWSRATTSLSEDRMSPAESRKYWEGVFAEAGVSSLVFESIQYPQRAVPKLPQTDDHDQPEEWNPDAGAKPMQTKERQLHPTCLDCLTHPIFGRHLSAQFSAPTPSVEPISVPDFWDLNRFGSLIPPDIGEALITAGLLVIDSRSKANSKILSTSFPSGIGDVRYPALFLEEEFLERKNSIDKLPLRLLNNTPPALLEQLASKLMSVLGTASDPSPSLIKWAFTVLKQLAWSDKPALAVPHIVRIVIGLPEQSSWHRVMLHPGVLKRLTVVQSKALATELATAISENAKERVKAQELAAQQATADEQGSLGKGKTSFVKVTTVKMLAKLMSDGEYFDEMFSVNVLAQLFQDSTHIDIRAAAVESLTSILSKTKDADVEETAIKFLEIHVVPVAAALSQRSPMTEERWAECEEKCELPEREADRPIMGRLDNLIGSKKEPGKARELIQRLYVPLVRKSMENTSRYMRILFRSHNAIHLIPQIPKAFGSDSLLLDFLRSHRAHMPAEMFQDLEEVVLFLLDPPQEIRETTQSSYVAGTAPFGRGLWPDDTGATNTLSDCADLCTRGGFATLQDAAANNLLTPTQLEAHARKVVDTLLVKYNEFTETWHEYMHCYDPPLRKRTDFRQNWQRYCRPTVQYTLERIESMRTPEWQQDPHRQPSRLPDTFQLRLWLLTYPSLPWEGDLARGDPRQAFVEELTDLMGELAESHRPYHARFEQVVRAVKQCYPQEWTFLAWQLGKLEDEQLRRQLTTAELLQVELSDSLLRGARGPAQSEEMSGVKAMLAQWRGCLDEDVRDRGISTTAHLVQQAKSSSRDSLPFSEEEA
ncbi:hypothetical protein Q7P37_004150 [Cladosporium fusiforme]